MLSKALDLFSSSIKRCPTPSAYYHAALTLSLPIPEQNLEKAIEYCRKAVEDEHMDVRHWHLLALLEAKLGEWKKARGVLEAALDIADDVEARVYAEEMRDSGIVTRDYQTSATTNGNSTHEAAPLSNGATSRTLIDSTDNQLPSAASLLRPLPDHPEPSHRELFEHALQLRMTYLALTELVEGPEAVEQCWLDVFEWYSQRRETNPQARAFS